MRRPSLTGKSDVWGIRIAAVLLLAATSLTLFGTKNWSGRGMVDEEAVALLDQVDSAWRMESLYLSTADRGELTTSRTTVFRGAGPSTMRVLAVGDSLTFGYGLINRELSWPATLVRLAAEKGHSIDVVSLSWPGASLFTYRDWLVALNACQAGTGDCPADLASVVGHFDAIVVGFYANDFQASPGDSILQRSGLPPDNPLADRASDHESYAGDVAAEIVAAAGDTPLYWFPLPGIGSTPDSSSPVLRWSPDRWWKLLGEPSMKRIEPVSALAALKSNSAVDLMVHPADYHPSALMHTAYARDVLVALELGRATFQEQSPLFRIHGAVPSARVTEQGEGFTVMYRPNPAWVCSRELAGAAEQLRAYWTTVQGAELHCDTPTRPEVSLREGNYPLQLGSPTGNQASTPGGRFPLPYQPCAAAGHPYVEIFTSTDEDSRLRVTASRGDLRLQTLRQDDTGRLTLGEIAPLGSGLTLSGRGLRSILISENGSHGCELGRRDHVGGFAITVNPAF